MDELAFQLKVLLDQHGFDAMLGSLGEACIARANDLKALGEQQESEDMLATGQALVEAATE